MSIQENFRSIYLLNKNLGGFYSHCFSNVIEPPFSVMMLISLKMLYLDR